MPGHYYSTYSVLVDRSVIPTPRGYYGIAPQSFATFSEGYSGGSTHDEFDRPAFEKIGRGGSHFDVIV